MKTCGGARQATDDSNIWYLISDCFCMATKVMIKCFNLTFINTVSVLYNREAMCLLRGTNSIFLHTLCKWTSEGQIHLSACRFSLPAACRLLSAVRCLCIFRHTLQVSLWRHVCHFENTHTHTHTHTWEPHACSKNLQKSFVTHAGPCSCM